MTHPYTQAEEGPYWERLLAEKTKAHWLKIDFTRWKDEVRLWIPAEAEAAVFARYWSHWAILPFKSVGHDFSNPPPLTPSPPPG